MQSIKINYFGETFFSLAPPRFFAEFRNGYQQMGAVETIGRRVAYELVLAVSLLAAVLEAVFRIALTILMAGLSCVLPQQGYFEGVHELSQMTSENVKVALLGPLFITVLLFDNFCADML